MILDLKMPDMDGLQLQAQIAAADSRMPTIFITAHADAVSEAQAQAAGARAFLSKPFEDKVLLDVVRRALGTEET